MLARPLKRPSPSRRLATLALLVVFTLIAGGANSCSTAQVREDQHMKALEMRDTLQAGDATIIMGNCGPQPIVGFCYIRRHAGDATAGTLRVFAPPAECEGSGSCASVRFIRPDSSEFVVHVPRGQTAVDVPWEQIINAPTFAVTQAGSWYLFLRVNWRDTDGRARISRAEGEIRFRIIAQRYQPLQEAPDSSDYVWNWQEGQWAMRATSALRAVTFRR